MGDSHSLGFHQGEALFTLAKTYPTLTLCMVEAVQNGIDAGATCIYVGIDQMEKRVAVLDNGNGVTVEKFQRALLSIGKGIKSKDALGRFGRGLIASIHLARSMNFLSSPRGSRKVNSWVFIGESLRRQHQNLKIPFESLEGFPRLPEPFTHAHTEARPNKRTRIQWRTMLLLDQVKDDRAITMVNPAELEHLIRTKLGHGMRQRGTMVYLKMRDEQGKITTRRIDPAAYDGEKLPLVTYETPQTGKVVIELYRARMQGGKRQGQVVAVQTGDNYPVTAQELRTQAMGARWYSKDDGLAGIKDGMDALCSGYFEGVIKAEKLELAPERTKFEVTEALMELYTLIADWYEKTGSPLLHDAREEQTAKRYHELGVQSLDRLMSQFRDNPALAPLAHGLRGALPGARTNRPEAKPRDKTSSDRAKKSDSRKVVVSPKQSPEGDKRSPVATFLSFAYELLKGSTRLWEYDPATGVLTFNIRHPVWAKVDPSGKRSAKQDKQVMQLQEWLAFELLLMLAEGVDPEEIELHHRSIIDRKTEYYVEVFILR